MTLRDNAVALRLDNDLSIRAIAQRIGVPRSTVGGWLRGVGEARHIGRCRLCRADFVAVTTQRRREFCSKRCATAHSQHVGRA